MGHIEYKKLQMVVQTAEEVRRKRRGEQVEFVVDIVINSYLRRFSCGHVRIEFLEFVCREAWS